MQVKGRVAETPVLLRDGSRWEGGWEESWIDGGRKRGNKDDEEGEERETEVLGVVMYVGLSERSQGRYSMLLTLENQHPHPLNNTHIHIWLPSHPHTHPPRLPRLAWMLRLTNNLKVAGLIPATDRSAFWL